MAVKILFVFILLSVPAYAEWVDVTRDLEGTTMYVNTEIIRRKGDIVEVLVLFDFSIARRHTAKGKISFVLSEGNLEQFNCQEERFRVLDTTWFSENMGKGTLIDNLTAEGPWHPLPRNNVGRRMLQFVCKK